MATQAIRLGAQATTRVTPQLVRTAPAPMRLPNPAVLFFRKNHIIPLRLWAATSAVTVTAILASVS